MVWLLSGVPETTLVSALFGALTIPTFTLSKIFVFLVHVNFFFFFFFAAIKQYATESGTKIIKQS